jgi:hypothetical protein
MEAQMSTPSTNNQSGRLIASAVAGVAVGIALTAGVAALFKRKKVLHYTHQLIIY